MNDKLTELLGGKEAIRKMMPDWYGIPEELSEEEKAFMRRHNLEFSSGYIGMLRCYKDKNQTVWQSSSGFVPVACAALGDEMPEGEKLRQAGREFLKKAMSLPEKELEKLMGTHVSLF